VLSVTGAKFINWSRGRGGGGAIDLVIHLTHRGFAAAIQWRGERFSSGAPAPLSRPPPPPLFHCPASDPSKLDHVVHYLVAQRGLALRLIASLVQTGSLYADPRAHAVFLLRDPQGRPVGAELRGTTPIPWRGLAPGSHKDLGFLSLPSPHQPTIVLCESAIDAMSCHALHPQHGCVSTAGARPNPRWLPALIAQAQQLYCGFDADPTGDDMAHAMISLYPTVQRLRPSLKDWNDVLSSAS
jgi:hypothetical protein